MIDSHPEWFKKALLVKKKKDYQVEEGEIFYQHWGDKSKPGIVLVHGSGSHSHWWDL